MAEEKKLAAEEPPPPEMLEQIRMLQRMDMLLFMKQFAPVAAPEKKETKHEKKK